MRAPSYMAGAYRPLAYSVTFDAPVS